MVEPGRPAGSYALLTDGSTVQIRAAVPGDGDAVRDMHAAMAPDNMYTRFFSLSPANADREAQRVCRAAGPDHMGLLAWSGNALVGVASYEVSGRPFEAEVAFAVGDDMHGRGIATLLLEYLVSIARQHRIRAFTAQTLAENSEMLRVFADAGLPVRRNLSDGVVELIVPLPSHDSDASMTSYLDAVLRRESNADVASLRHLLQPESVAVIGASRRAGSVGMQILRNIVAGGFTGRIYPVNPHAHVVAGMPCIRAVADLPPDVDMAVIAVPAPAITEVADQCGRRGVRSLVVVTSGLGEAGPELLATCHEYGMRLVGPNCFGIAVPGIGLDATFGRDRSRDGVAGLAVQSGGLGVSLTEHLSRLDIGISSFASVGDKYDVSGNDLLAWWEQDGQTRIAILYLESFGNPRKFAKTARRVGRQMPVLTVIGGRSAGGQRAALSHTAAAATPLVTREALFAQAGIVATASLGELIRAAAIQSCQPSPAGRRVAVMSNAGGAGVLAADACGDGGLMLPPLSESTRRRLAQILPAQATIANPVDTTAAIDAATFRDCLETIAADDCVDAVITIIVPTAIADLTEALTSVTLPKPLVAAALDQAEDVRLLPSMATNAIPCFAYPEGAVKALSYAARYGMWRSRPQGQVPDLPEVRDDEARALVTEFLRSSPQGGWLPAASVRDLLGCYQIPHVPTVVAGTEQEAIAAAAALGGPVVLKAEAEGIVHKTEAGAVRLDVRNEAEVKAAYQDLATAFGGALRGVLVQPMLRGGVEVLIGVVQEPVFGPLVVFGLGGVATNLLGDHSARLSPLTDADARELMAESQAVARLIGGYRGQPGADAGALADVLVRVSRLADDLPEVAELDLNPVIARADGCQAADARVRVVPAEPWDPFLRRLR